MNIQERTVTAKRFDPFDWNNYDEVDPPPD